MPLFSDFLKAVNELVYGSAQTYWGTPISDPSTGTQSPRFAELLVSIHTKFLILQREHDPHCASFTGLTPGTFLCLAKSFPFVHDFETPLATTDLNVATKAYYIAMDMPHSDSGISNMPLLSVGGLAQWILWQLWTHPSETPAVLNNMLAGTKTPLIDGSTGKEFLYKTIPDECLPELRADAGGLVESRLQDWKDSLLSQRLSRAQNGIGMQQQRYMQMQLQRQQNIQMMALASQGAVLAQYQAWNTGINIARMSAGQF